MKKHFLFLSALALFLSSCEIFSSLSEKTGAISIKMPEGSERIAETYDVNEITSFTAELYDSGSSPVAKVSSAPGKSITFESLTPGSYAIVIKAFKSTECAAYAEKSGIVVEAGATTYETITLFKNIIKNIESVEIAKESLDKITKNYTVGQTFALPEAVSITARFTSGYEKELEPDDYEIYICNAEQFAESSLVKDLTLSAKARFAAVGICTESGHKKYSEPVSLVMNAEEPVVTWTIPVVKDNEISFKISASASGNISYTWQKASTAGMEEKTDCEIEIGSDGTVTLPLTDNGAYVYYVCTVTNTNSAVNGTKTASKQTDVFGGELESFTAKYTGEYETPGQLGNITAFEITEKYADGYVLNIQSLPVNYKIAYAENLSNPEHLVGNIPLVITNLAAFDADGKNLTYEVTVPFKYSFDEDDLAFEITADGGKQEKETITIAQYSGIITLSASNSLPAYMLYDNGIYTDISNTVSYAWYADEELSTTIENGTIGNLVENVTYYYCVQTITSNPDEWYVPSAKYQKSITIETEPWVIEITKDGSQVDGSSLDSGTYTLSCTNSCANGSEKRTFEGKGESVTIEGNSLTIKQQADNTTATITAYINGQSAATKEYTIPAEGTYIVTFNTDGGSAVDSQTVNYNSTARTPTAPTKEGYTFAGWYTDTDCTVEYNFSGVVTKNITLYAKWTVNTYTVTFNTDGGSAVDSQTVNYNSTATTPTEPTKTGYTFAGWYTDADCSTEYNFTASVTGNITLYAKWTVEVITNWSALSAKLKDDADVGDIYISGDFYVTTGIIFFGTANIISTGTGVTFSRNEGCTDEFFYLNPKSLTFKGSESAPIVFNGKNIERVSSLITNGGMTTFEYCSFKNNSSSSYASVYLMDNCTSDTTFKFCSFTGNKGPKGGTVYVGTGDKVCFENCRFENNTSENNTSSSGGGAVYIADSATGTFSDCRFENNTSSSDGGAVYIAKSATGTFSDCIFGNAENETLGNYCTGATGGGGAVYATGASITLSNCEFYYNKATGDCGNGGAIGADSSSTVTITVGCIFNNNETASADSSLTHGGALYINNSSLVLPNSGNIFENNIEGNKTESILSDIYIVPGTINGSDSYTKGSYTVAENGSLTLTSTSQ